MASSPLNARLHRWTDLQMRVAVRIGAFTTTLEALTRLRSGDVVCSTRRVGEPFELLIESTRAADVFPVASDEQVIVKLLGESEDEA